jgi:phage shock protein A
MEKAIAQAKVQFNQIQTDHSRTEKKIAEMNSQISLWKDRARRIAATDESKALECVRRIKGLQDETTRLKEAVSELTATEFKLEQNIFMLEERLREIKRRKNSLLCRQSCTDALHAADKAENRSVDEISRTFNSWESAIMVNEYISGEKVSCDELNRECEQEEQAAELKCMLDDIINETEKE